MTILSLSWESLYQERWSSLQWRHNGHDSISNHQPHDCLLNRLFRRRSKKTSKLRVTGLCAGNSPGTGEFPAQMASNVENVSIWWRHYVYRNRVLEYNEFLWNYIQHYWPSVRRRHQSFGWLSKQWVSIQIYLPNSCIILDKLAILQRQILAQFATILPIFGTSTLTRLVPHWFTFKWTQF